MTGKTKFGIFIGGLVLAVMLSISFVSAKNEVRSPAVNSQAAAVDQNAIETTLRVSGLFCGSCLATIEEELRKFDGMLGMRADLSRGLVTVSHTEVFSPGKIAEVVTATGYPAELVAADSGLKVPVAGAVRGSGCGGGSGCGPRGCGLPAMFQEKS